MKPSRLESRLREAFRLRRHRTHQAGLTLSPYGDDSLSRIRNCSSTAVGELVRECVLKWVRFSRQFGGLAKVDSGFDYAASFSACSSIA